MKAYIIKQIVNTLEDKNHFYASSMSEREELLKIIKILESFQYCPNKKKMIDFIKNIGTEEEKISYFNLLNDYSFIPINTIIKSVKEIDSENIKIAINTSWAKIDGRPKENIMLDISGVDGDCFSRVLNTLKQFFNSGVEIISITPQEDIELDGIYPGINYICTFLVNPKTYNPFGIIAEEIQGIKELKEFSDISDEDFNKLFENILVKYEKWANEALEELYDWFFVLENPYISVPLEKNTEKYNIENEMVLEILTTNNFKIIDFIKRTLPLASITTENNEYSIKFSMCNIVSEDSFKTLLNQEESSQLPHA